jgi:WD40 repeat protein
MTRIFHSHQKRVIGLAYSPSSQKLLSGRGDTTARLYSREIRSAEFTLEDHSSEVNTVAFSPTGQRVASASGNNTILWSVQAVTIDFIFMGM